MPQPNLLIAAVALCLPVVAAAQTLAPAPPGLADLSRPALGTAARASGPRAAPAGAVKAPPPPKLTAAERAEKRKLDHDLNICIGC